LALRSDVGLLVAAQRNRMEILTWDLENGSRQSWAVASVGERLRESVAPRLHGGPPWMPRWVGISPDATRVASYRDDGIVRVWTRGGAPITSFKLTGYLDLDPAFAPDGTLLGMRAFNGRLTVVNGERERVVVDVEDGAGRSVRRAALLLGTRAS